MEPTPVWSGRIAGWGLENLRGPRVVVAGERSGRAGSAPATLVFTKERVRQASPAEPTEPLHDAGIA